jgi:hypothetical protein
MSGNSRIYVVGDNAYGSRMGNIGGGIKKVVDAHDKRSGDFQVSRVMPDHATTMWLTENGARYYDEWFQSVANGVGEMKWARDPGMISRALLGDIHEIDDSVGRP